MTMKLSTHPNGGAARPRLLVIDDEPDIAEFVRDVAGELGFEAQAVYNADAFKTLMASPQDVVVLDLGIPGSDGIELIRHLAQQSSQASLLLMSGFDQRVLQTAAQLVQEHGLTYLGALTKPISYETLEGVLSQTLHHVPDALASGLAETPDDESIRRALDRGEITAHFQPKVDLVTQRITGAEALARWVHPTQGILPPGAFIPAAKRLGLVDALTTAVLDASLAHFERFADSGMRLAINVEASSLTNLAFPDHLMSRLRGRGLRPNQLVLEVTESGVLDKLVLSLDVLARLSMRGVGLSIDDFGTGYSTLKQLQQVPFTELKIDKTFVDKLTHSAASENIVRTMVELGHTLSMTVVAEGVETAEQLDLLRKHGCVQMQGYLFSPALPAEDFTALLRQRGAKR